MMVAWAARWHGTTPSSDEITLELGPLARVAVDQKGVIGRDENLVSAVDCAAEDHQAVFGDVRHRLAEAGLL